MAALLHRPLDLVEEPVGPRRREGAALGHALVPRDHHPVGQDAGGEVAAHEAEQAGVRDPPRPPSQAHVVVDPVEDLRQVDVHPPPPSGLEEPLGRTHRVVRPAPGPDAGAVLREGRGKAGLQDLQDGLLEEPVEPAPGCRDF